MKLDVTAEHRAMDPSLGWSVRLFMIVAAVIGAAGVVIPVAFRLGGWDAGGFVDFLMYSDSVDEALLGRTPAAIVASEPSVVDVQLYFIDLAASLLLAVGALLGFLTWFGLREGHRWAWWAITTAAILTGASLARVVVPVVVSTSFDWTDVPPIFWVALFVPIPLILGWRGTASRRPGVAGEVASCS